MLPPFDPARALTWAPVPLGRRAHEEVSSHAFSVEVFDGPREARAEAFLASACRLLDGGERCEDDDELLALLEEVRLRPIAAAELTSVGERVRRGTLGGLDAELATATAGWWVIEAWNLQLVLLDTPTRWWLLAWHTAE